MSTLKIARIFRFKKVQRKGRVRVREEALASGYLQFLLNYKTPARFLSVSRSFTPVEAVSKFRTGSYAPFSGARRTVIFFPPPLLRLLVQHIGRRSFNELEERVYKAVRLIPLS